MLDEIVTLGSIYSALSAKIGRYGRCKNSIITVENETPRNQSKTIKPSINFSPGTLLNYLSNYFACDLRKAITSQPPDVKTQTRTSHIYPCRSTPAHCNHWKQTGHYNSSCPYLHVLYHPTHLRHMNELLRTLQAHCPYRRIVLIFEPTLTTTRNV